jgi:hypothetical protein
MQKLDHTILNLTRIRSLSGFLLVWLAVGIHPASSADDAGRLKELDALWAEVSRSVKQGDFKGYSATCHKEGILVSGTKKYSQPLSEALVRWKPEFLDTKAGKIKASVEFRFSQRIGGDTTAHETGMFRYATIDADGEASEAFIHFEALLVKTADGWKVLMEYQKSEGTEVEWAAIATLKH